MEVTADLLKHTSFYMKYDKKTIGVQNLSKYLLILFTEFRSVKVKNDGTVTFWKRNKSLLNNSVTISFTDLLYKHIPEQMSYYKTRSLFRYETYLNEIGNIFLDQHDDINHKIISLNEWLRVNLNNTIITNLCDPRLEKYVVKIHKGNLIKKKLTKNRLKIRTDLFDPLISRVHKTITEFNFNEALAITKVTLRAALIATLIKLQVMFTSLPNKDVYLEREDSYTEQMFDNTKKHMNICYISQKTIKQNNAVTTLDSS